MVDTILHTDFWSTTLLPPFRPKLINRKITDHHTASRGNWKPFLDKRQASAWYEKI